MTVSHACPCDAQEAVIILRLLGDPLWDAMLEPQLTNLLVNIIIEVKWVATPTQRECMIIYS